MNYKDLFHIAILLISSPARAWEEISLEDRRKVFTTFVYPMIGLCGLSVFIGSLMKMGWDGPQSFQYAMTQCCAVAVSLFGGYFLAAYLINGLRVRMFMLDSDIPLAQQFAGYALVVVFMLRIVIGILPDFGIMALLLQFYIVYVVWEGSKKVMQRRMVKEMQVVGGPNITDEGMNKINTRGKSRENCSSQFWPAKLYQRGNISYTQR